VSLKITITYSYLLIDEKAKKRWVFEQNQRFCYLISTQINPAAKRRKAQKIYDHF